MDWFKHDTTASTDSKIQALRITHGGAAVDAYWFILERIYREETDLVLGENRTETKSVTHWLCTDWETLQTWFFTMGEMDLLSVVEDAEDGSYRLSSARATARMEEVERKAETARENGKKGGRPKNPKTQKNQAETKPVIKENPGKPRRNQTKTKTVLVPHKGEPNTASRGADAGRNPAPRDEKCPDCGSYMAFVPGSWDTADQWWCDTCKGMKEPGGAR